MNFVHGQRVIGTAEENPVSTPDSGGVPAVANLIDEWMTARAGLAALATAEHPDITDVDGRVWTWWKGTLYRTPRPDLYPPTSENPEGGRTAWPLRFIQVEKA